MHVLTRAVGFMQMRKPFNFSIPAFDTSSPSGNLETYVGVNLGAEPGPGERRYIAVAWSGVTGGAAQSVTGITIAGIAATQVVTNGSSSVPSAVFIAEVPTGTAGNIVVSFSGAVAIGGIVVARIINPGVVLGHASTTATHVAGVVTLSINVPETGQAIAIVAAQNALTSTWVGLTELMDVDEGSGEFVSGASGGTAGTPLTITATNADTTPTQLAGCAASWGP